jgi:hypothetical protein
MPDLTREPAPIVVAVLWPSFLVALVAEFVFFALVDPAELPLLGVSQPLPRSVVYTFGFFAFWTLGSVAAALALYFAGVARGASRPDAPPPAPPFQDDVRGTAKE